MGGLPAERLDADVDEVADVGFAERRDGGDFAVAHLLLEFQADDFGLLDGALRFYQSTGITLVFAVRVSNSGTAELSGRAARRVRRTYETTTYPSMTRSQFENGGFGVSVQ